MQVSLVRVTNKPVALLAAASLMALFIAIVIVLADTAQLGFLYRVYDYRHGDKVAHFLLYGLLSLLVNLAVMHLMPRQRPERVALLTSLGLALAILVEELFQVWFPSRSPDSYDLVAGFAGVAVSPCWQ